jgi:RNA polymerase sigma-70 factor, ECF subfamily
MNEQLFHRLYDQFHQDVFQFLMYLVKDRLVAEDLSQEVYIRAIRSYDTFQKNSSEKTWLFAIAKNISIDYFRKQNLKSKHTLDYFDWDQEQLMTTEKTPDQQAILNEEKGIVLQALEKCTEDQKFVVILRYIQQLSVNETAQVLDWTEAKVKTTQHRAIQKLKDVLNKMEWKGERV